MPSRQHFVRIVTQTCALGAALNVAPRVSAQETIALTHVSIVDVITGAIARDRTLITSGGRIASIAPSRSAHVPATARSVDGSGWYLIPGLWDMHIHSQSYDYGRRYLPSLVALGITGVRDMGAPLEDVLRLRSDTRAGAFVGPRMIVSGPLLEAPLPFHVPFIAYVATPGAAIQIVDSLIGRGVDFIKVHDALARAVYLALADEAKKSGTTFVGHIPLAVTALEASAAGQKSIEHLGGRFYGELLSCSDREPALRKQVDAIAAAALRELQSGREPDDVAFFRSPLTASLARSFSRAKERAMIATFRRNHTWQVPTLVSQPLRAALSDTSSHPAPIDVRDGRLLLARMDRLVRDMQRAGVGILAGTDLPIERSMLGEELERLVAAGLTPLQALQAATINPARFLGITDSLGAIRSGQIADVVALDRNPLRDIRAVTDVRAVILRGHYLDHRTLDSLQAAAR